MAFGEKKNLDFHRNLGIEDGCTKTMDFLKNTGLEAPKPGKYEIDGENVYASVTAYTTIPWEEAKYEAYEHYADVQYVIERSEIMSYASIHEVIVKVPYNPNKDVVLSKNTTPGLQVATDAGQYLIFNPWDVHKPGAANGEPAPIKRVIVKIKED